MKRSGRDGHAGVSDAAIRSRPHVAVVGGGAVASEVRALAEEVGRRLGEAGAVVVCGGLGGVMEAVCRGAKAGGGLTIGIVPGRDRDDANNWVDVVLATGLGEVRNVLVVRSADAVIAVDGEYGTLSEIGFALKTHVPVVGLRTWVLERGDGAPSGIVVVENPADAVETVLRLIREERASRP